MSAKVTKTLELKLVNPTAQKLRKLRETKRTYQAALRDAFRANCTSPSAANEIVVQYELSGYSKNALKRYVPQLCGGSYEAKDLHDDHPVRFTNEGVRLDHKPQNTIEWYVKIPHHEDYHLWLPAQSNPDQREWLEALYANDAKMGESRLSERGGEWYLQIAATRDVDRVQRTNKLAETPIGVDIGEATLVAVCHRDDGGSPTAPKLWNDAGKEIRRLRKEYFSATRRLQRRGSVQISKEYGDAIWKRIDHVIHSVTAQVIEYADEFDNPILVLEDLTNIRENLDYGTFLNRRLHGWAFAKIQTQIRYKAADRGILVETVNPAYTSKTCHQCGEIGHRPNQATFQCCNSDCWISEYHADLNASLRIADRYLIGESPPRENPGDNDSVEDGAHLTAPQDSQADA